MRAIAIVSFVALLLTILPHGVRTELIIDILNEMSDLGGKIDGLFKPSKDGFLGASQYGIVYEGTLLLKKKRKVAMKFVHMNNTRASENEYRAYTYLNSITSNVEIYGIPKIYYYGTWSNHTMLAMKSLDYKTKNKSSGFSEWDLLVFFREFVKIIKYIHSRGIIHNKVGIDNLIIHKGQGFMFGFCSSVDMADDIRANNIRDAKNDFRDLLSSLWNSSYLLRDWPWFPLTDEEKRLPNLVTELHKLASENKWRDMTGTKRIFLEFSKHASNMQTKSTPDANGNSIPFYDQLYQAIIEEMKEKATSSNPVISSIPDPFGPEHDFRASREEVNPHYFEEMYAGPQSGCWFRNFLGRGNKD